MLELKNGCGFIRDLIKSFFSPVGGGRTSFASQNGNQSRKEDLRQEYNYSSSNSDFNRKRGGSVLNLPSFASENIVGGGSYARIVVDWDVNLLHVLIQQAVALLKEDVLTNICQSRLEVKAITLA